MRRMSLREERPGVLSITQCAQVVLYHNVYNSRRLVIVTYTRSCSFSFLGPPSMTFLEISVSEHGDTHGSELNDVYCAEEVVHSRILICPEVKPCYKVADMLRVLVQYNCAETPAAQRYCTRYGMQSEKW